MSASRNPLMSIFSVIARIYRAFRSLVLNLIFIVFVILLFSSLRSASIPTVPVGAALVLAPNGVIVEESSLVDPLSNLLGTGLGGEVRLQDMLDAIQLAADDSSIAALVLQLDGLQGAGLSKLQDIGLALDSFRDSGKKIYAIGDSFSQGQYYLASHADEIILNPMGAVDLQGFSSFQPYFGEALEHLGVNMHVFRVGDYKSAVEPFESAGMSDEARANSQALVDEFWELYLREISSKRGLAAGAINELVNTLDEQLAAQGGDSAGLALQFGLVDRLAGRSEILDYLGNEVGLDSERQNFRQIDLAQYLRSRRPPLPSLPQQRATGDQVALIIASGTIYDGYQLPGSIGGDSLSQLIRQARDDDAIKALVLRIDSPGGSAFASEVIRSELLSFKASGKPLVVSMSSVAASGGYWIAAPADEIWASPGTVTGSIGIFAIYPSFERSLARLGIYSDGVSTNAHAGAFTLGRDLPEITANSIQLALEHGYERFLEIVAEGRGLDRDAVASAGQGQVWSASAARELGLIDYIGNTDDALASAAELAGLEHYQRRLLSLPLSPGQQFLRNLSESVNIKQWFGNSAAGRIQSSPFYTLYLQFSQDMRILTELNDPRGLYLQCYACTTMP